MNYRSSAFECIHIFRLNVHCLSEVSTTVLKDIEMDVDPSISTGWASDQNFEFEIPLQFCRRHFSSCRDLQIPRTKNNGKLFVTTVKLFAKIGIKW